MLPKVAIGRHCCAKSTHLDNYRPLVGNEIIDEIEDLSRTFRGLRVCQINATASGGGVAELLEREIPIYRALGLNADWRLIHGDRDLIELLLEKPNIVSEFGRAGREMARRKFLLPRLVRDELRLIREVMAG